MGNLCSASKIVVTITVYGRIDNNTFSVTVGGDVDRENKFINETVCKIWRICGSSLKKISMFIEKDGKSLFTSKPMYDYDEITKMVTEYYNNHILPILNRSLKDPAESPPGYKEDPKS